MSDFKTGEVLENLHKIFTSSNHTEEEKEFVELRNLKLAEALIIDFNENDVRKIAKAILVLTDEPKRNPRRWESDPFSVS